MRTLHKMLFITIVAMFAATQAQAVLFFARPYDPNLQRWIQRDPIGERGGQNLYGYVQNNPVNKVDPLGLQMVGWNNQPIFPQDYRVLPDGSSWTWNAGEAQRQANVRNFIAAHANDNQSPWQQTAGVELQAVIGGLSFGMGPVMAALDGAADAGLFMNLAAGKTSQVKCPVASPIKFGTQHALPHFEGTGLSQSSIENQIQNELQGQLGNFPSTVNGPFMGRIPFQGQTIEYRGFGLENGTINIGTYYPK